MSTAAICKPPVLPTWAAHSSPRSSTVFSNAGGLRIRSRLLHWVHDHSSTPGSNDFVRVISCGLDNRTPISGEPSQNLASHAYPRVPGQTGRRVRRIS